MQTQFDYITDLARTYEQYASNDSVLYEAINKLSDSDLDDIFKEYGDPDRKFAPVNLLRAEIATRLLHGMKVTKADVESIKKMIRRKDRSLLSHFSKDLLDQMEEYPLGRRDIFANWQKAWSIFHTFFYRSTVKETVQNYIDQLTQQLIEDLKLSNYISHTVDFQGANNFGNNKCWIALYPETKNSHKDAYQFFVRLQSTPEAGRAAGHSLKNAKPNRISKINSYQDIVDLLRSQHEEIIKLNRQIRNYFKFAPGPQASLWELFRNENVAAITFKKINLNDFISSDEVMLAAGLSPEEKSNMVMGAWLFKQADLGDVIFATKGVNTVVGIGIIESEYTYQDS
ncbi:MAG: hypothetical protein WD491_00510 [Balneolales bacterium]